jgi:hypothetical protein
MTASRMIHTPQNHQNEKARSKRSDGRRRVLLQGSKQGSKQRSILAIGEPMSTVVNEISYWLAAARRGARETISFPSQAPGLVLSLVRLRLPDKAVDWHRGQQDVETLSAFMQPRGADLGPKGILVFAVHNE